MLAFERRWARHLLSAFAPVGGTGLAPAPDEVDYDSALLRMMRGATPLAALGLRIALWLAALAPLWLWGRLSTVATLAAERKTEMLGQLLTHRVFAVRELTLLLKLCAAMALLGTPSVRARSGYDPGVPHAGRVSLPLVDTADHPIEHAAVRSSSRPSEAPLRGGA